MSCVLLQQPHAHTPGNPLERWRGCFARPRRGGQVVVGPTSACTVLATAALASLKAKPQLCAAGSTISHHHPSRSYHYTLVLGAALDHSPYMLLTSAGSVGPLTPYCCLSRGVSGVISMPAPPALLTAPMWDQSEDGEWGGEGRDAGTGWLDVTLCHDQLLLLRCCHGGCGRVDTAEVLLRLRRISARHSVHASGAQHAQLSPHPGGPSESRCCCCPDPHLSGTS